MSVEFRKNFKRNPGPVLAAVSDRYGIPPDSIRPVAGTFANLIYSVRHDSREYILRLTPETHRSTALIESELHWIDFLAGFDVPVVEVGLLNNSRRLEIILVNGSRFSAVCFKKARGVIAAELDKFCDDKLFKEWGRVMGGMHALSKIYTPGGDTVRRYDWFDDTYLKTDRYLPENQPLVREKFHRLIDNLHRLPRDIDSYGLIHADFHKRNIFVDDGRITLFDFDDCQYCWYAGDIAVSLFSVIIRAKPGTDRAGVAREFLKYFLDGYATENKIDPASLNRLPLFLKLREMINYIDGSAHWDMNRLTSGQRELIDGYRFNIENDVPLVDMDFSDF